MLRSPSRSWLSVRANCRRGSPSFNAGDSVIKSGESSPGIFFLKTGTVALFNPDQNCVKGIVAEGDYLGDFFLLNKTADFDYECKKSCYCLFVEKEEFTRIVARCRHSFNNVHAAALVRSLQLMDLLYSDKESNRKSSDNAVLPTEEEVGDGQMDRVYGGDGREGRDEKQKNRRAGGLFGLLNLTNFADNRLMSEPIVEENEGNEDNEYFAEEDLAEEGHANSVLDLGKKLAFSMVNQRMREYMPSQLKSQSRKGESTENTPKSESLQNQESNDEECKGPENLPFAIAIESDTPKERITIPTSPGKMKKQSTKDGLRKSSNNIGEDGTSEYPFFINPFNLPSTLEEESDIMNKFKRDTELEADDSIEMDDPVASMSYGDVEATPLSALTMVEVIYVFIDRQSMDT